MSIQITIRPLLLALLLAKGFCAQALPSGAVLTAGQAKITQAGNFLGITQTSANAIIQWQSFNLGPAETVQFFQPNAQSIILNQVLGSSPSTILGRITANGQVFLTNPNGILFGPTASVDVGGLIASTLGMQWDPSGEARIRLAGGSSAAVINQGNITLASGGQVSLVAAVVSNKGLVVAQLGQINLIAANGVTIMLPTTAGVFVGPIIFQGALGASIENEGRIQADGGTISLFAQNVQGTTTSAIVNKGALQAQTIENRSGVIRIVGDMQSGFVNITGSLDASAPSQGNGGLIETSAAHVRISDTALISTATVSGKPGLWLIDPIDLWIGGGDADITIETLRKSLETGDVSVVTHSSGQGRHEGKGDILINEALVWVAKPEFPTTLQLNAVNDIILDYPVTTTNGSLVFNAGQDVNINAAITTTGGGITSFSTRNTNLVNDTGRRLAALTTTDGSMSWIAGQSVTIDGAAMTTTKGSVTLAAGSDGFGKGSVIFSGDKPSLVVTGAGAVNIFNPLSAAQPIDYSKFLTLTEGATLSKFIWVTQAGLTGATGATGATGLNGAQGLAGSVGAAGATGLTGLTGLTGATGATGTTGAQGIQGVAGSAGAAGSVGATGAAGNDGVTGSVGAAGATGLTGLTGATGATGAQGIQGVAGSAGAAGSVGATGAAGIDGATGPVGDPGQVGETGAEGATGIQGEVGAQGLQGVQGMQGTYPQTVTGVERKTGR